MRGGNIPNRSVDPYDIDPEDEKYLLETGDYWDKNSMSAMTDEYMPEGLKDIAGNMVIFFGLKNNCQSPVGHFCGNFWTATRKGFGAIAREAREHMKDLEEKGIFDKITGKEAKAKAEAAAEELKAKEAEAAAKAKEAAAKAREEAKREKERSERRKRVFGKDW